MCERAGPGGDGEIRTLGTELSVRRFSKPLVSATHPRLQIAAAKAAYSGGVGGRQEAVAGEFSQAFGASETRPVANPTRLGAGSLPGNLPSIQVPAPAGRIWL
jgi:hypothetical protein